MPTDKASPPSTSGRGKTLEWAIQNRKIIEAHVVNQRTTWDLQQAADPAASDSVPSVRVFVRVRPLAVGKAAQANTDEAYAVAEVQPPRLVHVSSPTMTWASASITTKTYEADSVFGPAADNAAVWRGLRLDEVLGRTADGAGGHAFFLCAYGQTGSGKTYSTTYIEDKLCELLFAESSQVESVTLSAFEIRGTQAFDLLSEPALAPVKIMAASDDSIAGLSIHDTDSAAETLALVHKAGALRTTRSTLKNDTSSRSHSVMRFSVTSKNGGAPSLLCILDLAGSERAATASGNADPARRREAISINTSLAALKDCIRARLAGDARVPWRGSTLTMVLRRAFAAPPLEEVEDAAPRPEPQLVVLACASPSIFDVEDTLGTLNYVTPFRLAGKAAVDAVNPHLVSSQEDPRQWGRADSIAWLSRNLPKLTAFIPRIFTKDDSTLANTLLPLASPAALIELITTAVPNEVFVPSPFTVSQAKALAPSYHAKLKKLLATAEAAEKRPKAAVKARIIGSTKQAALDALSGKDRKAHVTSETNIDWGV